MTLPFRALHRLGVPRMYAHTQLHFHFIPGTAWWVLLSGRRPWPAVRGVALTQSIFPGQSQGPMLFWCSSKVLRMSICEKSPNQNYNIRSSKPLQMLRCISQWCTPHFPNPVSHVWTSEFRIIKRKNTRVSPSKITLAFLRSVLLWWLSHLLEASRMKVTKGSYTTADITD